MKYLEKAHSDKRQLQLYFISPHFSGMDHLDHQMGWFHCKRCCNLKCNYLMSPFLLQNLQTLHILLFKSVSQVFFPVTDTFLTCGPMRICVRADWWRCWLVCLQAPHLKCLFFLITSEVLMLKETLVIVFFAAVSAALCPQRSGLQIFELQHMTWKLDCDEPKTEQQLRARHEAVFHKFTNELVFLLLYIKTHLDIKYAVT